MSEKFCFGETELLIVFGDGVYHVLRFEKEIKWYELVYTGNYEECLEYCERQEVLYEGEKAGVNSTT